MLKTIIDVTSTVAFVATLIIVGMMWTTTDPRTSPQAPERTASVDYSIDLSQANHVFGEGDVAIIEFTDPDCVFCQRHAKDVLPVLEEKLAGVQYFTVQYKANAVLAKELGIPGTPVFFYGTIENGQMKATRRQLGVADTEVFIEEASKLVRAN